jgi:hypothetical protein
MDVKKFLDLMADVVAKSLAPFAKRIEELEAREPQRGENGEPGSTGLDGEKGGAGEKGDPGMPGKDGRDGVDGKDGAPGEKGDDGAPGVDGKDGAAGRDGVDGKDGMPGKDGQDGKSIMLDDVLVAMEAKDEARFAKWALSVERRVYDAAEKAISNMPKPKDGKDGLTFENFRLEDGGRVQVLVDARGSEVNRQKTQAMIYRGVFDADVTYEIGDGVTFGGSLWIAVKDEGIRGNPGTVDAWKLAVKKGRDGRGAT